MKAQSWFVLLAVGIMAILIDLDMTIVNMAMPAIAKQFVATLGQMQWIGSSYAISALAVMIFGGQLADHYLGKKRIYLLGILLFFLGSVIAGCAFGLSSLIIGRIIQGLGFGVTIALGVVLLTSVFPKKNHGLIIGIYMALMGIAQALGPPLGGWILSYSGWRLLFLINLLPCLIAFLCLHLMYKEDLSLAKKQVDWSGFMYMISALVLLMFSIEGASNGEILKTVLLTSFFVVFCLLLFKNEQRHPMPLFNFKLLTNKPFAWITFARSANMYIWGTILLIIPCYLQNILTYSAKSSGLILLGMTIVFTCASPLVGKFVDLVGSVKPILFSVGLSIFSLACLIFAKSLPLPFLIVALSFIGLSTGIMATASVKFVTDVSPPEKTSQSMGLFYTFMLVGFSLGIALSSRLLAITSFFSLKEQLADAGINVSATLLEALSRISTGISSFKDFQITSLQRQIAIDSFYTGLNWVIGLCFFLNVISILLYHRKLKNQENHG